MTRLTQEVFDFFAEPKSRSNVWSRQRLEIKQGLLAFTGSFVEELRLLELGLEASSSDHYPSLWNSKCVDRQWIFFSRGKEARRTVEEVIDRARTLNATIADPTPYVRNVFLALDLNAGSIGVAVHLHWKAWVDRDNFLKRLDFPQERERWLEILRALPEEYLIKIDGMDPLRSVDVTGELLDRMLGTFRSVSGFFSTGLFIPKEQILTLDEDVWGVLKVAFMLLVPVYEFVAWSPDSDFISMSDRQRAAEEKKLELARLHEMDLEAFKAQKEKEKIERKQRRRELVEKQKDIEGAWAVVREKERRERAALQVPAPPPAPVQPEKERRPPEPEPPPVPKLPSRPAERPRPERREAEKRPVAVEEAEPGDVAYGDKVKILEGVFRGKWGVVQEVDGRGNVKVILGSMVARLPLAGVRLMRFR